MVIRLAREEEAAGFIELAGQVEQWFGPMVGEPGFRTVLTKHIRRGTALVAETAASGARPFYERLGFTPAEPAGPGPDGGSRQVFKKTVTVPDRHRS